MDDSNTPKIPASNILPPSEPVVTPPPSPTMEAMPDMPMPGPVTTTTTTTAEPISSPLGEQTTTSTTTETSSPAPTFPSEEWPASKPKSKMPQILGGIAAIILVVGVATAAYFVSNRISGRQAVAPTAPVSEPMAAGNCPQGCGKNEVCTVNGCRNKPAEPTGYGTGYTCTSSNCPGPCFACNAAKTSCIAKTGVSGCEGVSSTGNTPTPTVKDCTVLALGAPCTTSSGTGNCRAAGPGAANYCQVTITSAPTPIVTIPSGACNMINGTSCFGTRKMKCKCAGLTVATCRWVTNEVQDCPGFVPFDAETCTKKTNCPAGTLPNCYGTQATCLPIDVGDNFCASGHPCPAGTSCTNGEPVGVPGSTFEGRICYPIGTGGGGNPTPTKKPGGGGGGNPNPTAPPTATGGACVETKLFAKTVDGYSATPMTTAQLASLKIGDKIRIAITGSKAELKARFKVSINNVIEPTGDAANPEWRMGQAYSAANHLTTYYSDYEIKKAGNYTFEGQVSTL